jgi:hypothetical protein
MPLPRSAALRQQVGACVVASLATMALPRVAEAARASVRDFPVSLCPAHFGRPVSADGKTVQNLPVRLRQELVFVAPRSSVDVTLSNCGPVRDPNVTVRLDDFAVVRKAFFEGHQVDLEPTSFDDEGNPVFDTSDCYQDQHQGWSKTVGSVFDPAQKGLCGPGNPQCPFLDGLEDDPSAHWTLSGNAEIVADPFGGSTQLFLRPAGGGQDCSTARLTVSNLVQGEQYVLDYDWAADGFTAGERILTVDLPATAVSDFNADSRSDILWRHTSGSLAAWLMDGTSVAGGGSLGSAPASAQIKGTGDLDGNGTADILWRDSSGAAYVWFMSGTTVSSVAPLGTIDSAWSIQGTGDFDGDRKADILWRHTSGNVVVWLMDGARLASYAILGAIDAAWQVKGIADFDGDGRADILWRHTSGSTLVTFMAGTTVAGSRSLGVVDNAWTIQGEGDFDGDGTSDILWRHSSGALAEVRMTGPTLTVDSLGTVPVGWQVQGLGDLNADGKADILWRHSSGTTYFWLMNGAAISSGGTAGTVDNAWVIQPR